MTAVAPLRRDALGAVARAGMSVFGIVIALFGAVMPVLLDRLSLGLADVGLVFLVTNGAMLGASVIVGPAMDRVGMKGAATTTDPGHLEVKDRNGLPEKNVLPESAMNNGNGESAVNLLNLCRKSI